MAADTQRFINDQPFPVILIPQVQERSHNGGFRIVDGPPRMVQTVRLLPQGLSAQSQIGPQRTTDGKDVRAEYILVALPTAVVVAGDYWEQDGLRYEVTYVYPSNGYELKAVVGSHG